MNRPDIGRFPIADQVAAVRRRRFVGVEGQFTTKQCAPQHGKRGLWDQACLVPVPGFEQVSNGIAKTGQQMFAVQGAVHAEEPALVRGVADFHGRPMPVQAMGSHPCPQGAGDGPSRDRAKPSLPGWSRERSRLRRRVERWWVWWGRGAGWGSRRRFGRVYGATRRRRT